jgi:hypothetical protein
MDRQEATDRADTAVAVMEVTVVTVADIEVVMVADIEVVMAVTEDGAGARFGRLPGYGVMRRSANGSNCVSVVVLKTKQLVMQQICPTCAADPTAHSFKKVADKQGVVLFYAHPSKAKRYDDHEGTIQHVDRMLASIGSRKWSCVLDGDGFDLRHATEVKLGQGLITLFLEKYAATMQQLTIINPTWHIEGVVKVAKMLLPPEIFGKIKLMDDRKRSVMEFF